MFNLHIWKWSWSLIASVVSVITIVSVVHLFWFPLTPLSSFSYFNNAQQLRNSCFPVSGSDKVLPSVQLAYPNLDHRFPVDLHNSVVYRGASWKAEIGQWLSGCDAVATTVSIVERISGKVCKSDCNGQAFATGNWGNAGAFMNFPGIDLLSSGPGFPWIWGFPHVSCLVCGEDCSERLQLNCNYPGPPEQPYGPWVVSICSAHCDTTKAMCFCGEGTKYPNRPVAESCGFQVNLTSEPGGPVSIDWAKADLDIGWCNVDPPEAYASKVRIKEQCECKYDCVWGRYCEIPTLCSCVNQCSGHGYCRGGFCQCDRGWYGTDCSIPSVLSSVKEWPQWLRPATINVPDNAHLTKDPVSFDAVVKKKRPLIYVYDLPPEFNSHLLEGRHFRLECVNRIYNDRNATFWTEQLYGSQMALYESLLASPYRTLNGEEADYFFVPVLDSCIITRADDAPHINMKDHLGLRSSLTLEFYKKAYDHIVQQYPFWNRTSGKDHIWFFSWDEGACYAPKEIRNSMMLVHWGNTNSKHNHSTTAYWADNWDGISSDKRGNHPCFDPEKDLVLPAWKRPDPDTLRLKSWSRLRTKRKRIFYFNGNLGPAYEGGRPEATYSMGIRQKLAQEFGSTPDKEGKLGKQHQEDVVVTSLRSANYHEELASSVFCGVLPGDGWSGRMEDSILHGCIPVVIQDGIFSPYENMLNYESFAIRIHEDEIPNLINILRGFNETEIEFMLANVRMTWQRFLYRDTVLLEAERQKSKFGYVNDWAIQYLRLNDDDVFSTFIQVLHYKLHNEPWRRKLAYHLEKDFGLPKECLQAPTKG